MSSNESLGLANVGSAEVYSWSSSGRGTRTAGTVAHVIALDALVKEAKPDRFRRQTRPALFDILKVKLPPSLFDYTLEVLKDAIMKYQDPYGHVSQLDKVEFDRCECIDKNGRPINHRKCLPAGLHQEGYLYAGRGY